MRRYVAEVGKRAAFHRSEVPALTLSARGDRPHSHLTVTALIKGAAATLLLFSSLGLAERAAAASRARPDPWTQSAGPSRAKGVIAQCLRRVAGTAHANEGDCVRAAFDTCEGQHGTESQSDLNECAYFSMSAWQSRLNVVQGRLAGAASRGKAFAPLVTLFRQSQQRWEAWNRPDCIMQTKANEGGTIHPLLMGLCLSDHAAHRALELDELAENWLH